MALTYMSTASGSGTQTGVTTGNINTTGAKLIVCNGAWYSGGTTGTNPTFTDSASNTWTKLTISTGGAYSNALWYCINPTTSPTHNFSLTGTDPYPSLQGSAFSAGGTPTYEAESGNSGLGGTSLQVGSITPNGNGRLFVTGLQFAAANTVSVDSSFTIGAQNDRGQAQGGAIAYKIQTTGGAENPTWSWTTSTLSSAVMATFVDGAAVNAIVMNLQIG